MCHWNLWYIWYTDSLSLTWLSEHIDPDTGSSVSTDLWAEGTDTTWSTRQERPRGELQVDAGGEGWTPQSVQDSGQNKKTSKCSEIRTLTPQSAQRYEHLKMFKTQVRTRTAQNLQNSCQNRLYVNCDECI